MPGLFGDAAEYGRGLLAAYDKWPGLAGLLGMRPAAEQIAQAGQAAQGKPLNDRGAVQGFLDSPVAMMMSTDPIRKVANPIRAYHGSPHDFDKFDLGKIGTGEGAQSYGHGLYFAENEKVARNYRDNLSNNRTQLVDDILKTFADAPEFGGLHTATGLISGRIGLGDVPQKYRDAVAAILAKPHSAEGRMYEVNLHANPQQFLDWDKPLSGQSAHTREALRKLGIEYDAKGMNEFDDALLSALHSDGPSKLPKQPVNPSGEDIYRNMGRNVVDMSGASSGLLRQEGIPGIRYLDQGSRRSGNGTSNYVVFDPSIIEIMRKYGIAAPVATAATGGLLGDGY